MQHTAARCNTLQRAATHSKTLQHTATHCITLQLDSDDLVPSFSQHIASGSSLFILLEKKRWLPNFLDPRTLTDRDQQTATQCNTLQHTLQHTAAHSALTLIVIRCVVVNCIVLQCVVVCRSWLQCTAVTLTHHTSSLSVRDSAFCRAVKCVAAYHSVMQCNAECCSDSP